MKRFVVALLFAAALPSPGAHAAAPPVVASLRQGGSAFWKGSVTAPARAGDALVYQYAVRVLTPARQLRVAFDHPDYRVPYTLEVVDPSGRQSAAGIWNSAELTFDNPRRGTWTVKVSLQNDRDTEFRLRARLEGPAKPKPRTPVALLPNLRLVPPYEFTFALPFAVARDPAYKAAGPASCTADDIAEHRAVRCLRFSVGPSNVGAGPMELIFAQDQGLLLPGEVTQRIRWSDGSVRERPAGTFLYHHTHMHYHHTGFGSLELFRVDNPATGALTKVGAGPKQGFCTGDVMIAEWNSFANDPQFSAHSTCLDDYGPFGNYDPTAGTAMGLSSGWADLYSWEQDGNYVDFGVNGDGYYVVRSTADAAGVIEESNESDNTGYAYIQTTGDTIRVLERGRGLSPWDPKKVVVRDGLRLLAR